MTDELKAFLKQHVEVIVVGDKKTRVVFRVFNDDGDLIALFPDEAENNGYILSYQHIGQHGAADYLGCIKKSRQATETEYRGLLAELKRVGYENLTIVDLGIYGDSAREQAQGARYEQENKQ